ncbi:CCA tRNA nucleotidyltransferase [Bacillus sp. NPDC094106]|uniref:CCA tRNA nucleotidyltransferase n=1 Tax=Bacillus sp. NPDC094106 TaxID=3363949 RepID=UPI0038076686
MKTNDSKQILLKVAKEIKNHGGRTFYVGGYVRDKFMNKISKDIDVEIYGITPDTLQQILSKFGYVDEIGASFGILKIHGVDIDFSMPRTEKKTADGHTGFSVVVDPFMDTLTASKRRDFTVNAIMEDVLTGEIIDHFNGIIDIELGIIQHINLETFVEDELRAFRACQFASRFNFTIAEETIDLCKTFRFSLPRERIFEEFSKALLKSEKPSIFFSYMREMLIIKKLFPELHALIDCPQSPIFHPEGDVWAHTLMVTDELAKLKHLSTNPLAFMLLGPTHDMGKPITTVIHEDGSITTRGHAEEGVSIAKQFLKRLTNDKRLIKKILNMVEHHMRPNQISFGTDKAVRRLMVATDITDIVLFGEADHKGRGISEEEKDYATIKKWFKEKIEKLKTDENKSTISPLVTGKDLILAGLKPGKEFSILLKKAFDLQIEYGLSKEEILEKILL